MATKGVEVANAYIVLTSKFPGVKEDIEEALGGSPAKKASEKAGKTVGDSMVGGIGKVLKGGAIALGAAGVATIGTAMVKGFQRLDALDQAEAKLAGLGHSASNIDAIMENALNSVRGTAFGMGDAATVAASTVAAGVKPGEELERTLKLVGDAATIAGTDMSTMGSIVNKVATSDMMQMDVANQLMDAGIPILQMVAEQMGVTAGEARDMASDGLISFETFQSALEAGLGGAALESGNTFQGAMANVGAALGRVGEQMLGGAFENMKGVFGDLNTIIDDLGPTFEVIGEKIGDVASVVLPALIDGIKNTVSWLQSVGEWIQNNTTWLGPIVVAIGAAAAAFTAWHLAIGVWTTVTNVAKAAQLAFNAVMAANPIMLVVMAVAALVAGLIWFFTQTELGQQIWANFTQFLSEAWTNTTQWLSEAWTNIVNFFTTSWETIKEVFSTAIEAVGGFFSGLWEGISNGFKSAINFVIDLLNGFLGGLNKVGGFLSDVTGGAIGFEVGTIPHLAEGGTVLPRRGGTLAVLAEAGRAESVVDTGLINRALEQGLAGAGGAGREGPLVEVHAGPGMDEREIGRIAANEIDWILEGA